MTKGILAFGAYIPWRRLPRKAIAETHGWFNPALKGQAKGERAFCNWDEDPVTMAVEAARDALTGRDRATVAALRFASTTYPFLDRLHSGIVAGRPEPVRGHLGHRCCRHPAGRHLGADRGAGSDSETLVVASEKRGARAASPVEMTSGDGAAAILVGEGKPIATLLAKASRTTDFVDHFRSLDNQFDYQWEERWIRDAGYMTVVPPVIKRCLEQAKVAAKDVTHFCMPATLARVASSVAKAAGIDDKAVCDPLHANCGDTGAAHTLLLLVAALEKAKAGDKILLVGFGQGADALLFEVTPEIAKRPKNLGVAGHLARRKEEPSYGRFLAFNDLIELERGMRSETDKATALSSLWRNRETVTSFIGGKCSKCGTLQMPRSDICVNPNCNAIGTQEPYPFAGMAGRIKSYTADRLTYAPDPPVVLWHDRVRGGRPRDDRLHRHRRRRPQGRPADADDVPHQGHRHRARLPPLLLESGPRRGQEPRRDPTMAKGIKDKVVIIGMGCSKFGERWDKEADKLMVEAYTEAIADAGIDTKQIDAAWLATAIEEQHVGKSATPLARGAAAAVHPGDAGGELLRQRHRGVPRRGLRRGLRRRRHRAGARRREAEGHRLRRPAAARPRPPQRHEQPERLRARQLRPARRRLPRQAQGRAQGPEAGDGARLGEEPRQRLQESQGAPAQQDHHRHRAQRADDRRAARPLRLLRGERRGRLRHRHHAGDRPALGKKDMVSVKALQLAVSNGLEAQHNSWDGSYFATTRIASKRAYAEAGIDNPRDQLSLIEVHDCFSMTELVTMEDLHISPEGGAIKDVLDGFYDADGKVPCQIDGGLKCFGHPIGASGLRMIYEMYLQMQGRAGERQLKDEPRFGLTHNLGGFPQRNVAAISIVGKYGA